MSLNFLKALLVLGCLILLIKHELNIQTPCGMSFSTMTTKTPFSSSLLISLHRESVNGVSYTRTDISAYRVCLADMPAELADIPAELADIPAELADMPAEVMWFSVTGFLFAGYFWGRPQPRFVASSVGSWGTSRVGRGTSSLSSLTSWVVLDQK